jgi:hypothetical protein
MGLKVGIVTSSPRHYAEAILKMFSIVSPLPTASMRDAAAGGTQEA